MLAPVRILGTRIDPRTRSQVLDELRSWLRDAGGQPRTVATVNAEFLVAAERDAAFRARLERADLALADGSGVIWAASFLARPLHPPLVWLKGLWRYVERGASLVLRPRTVLDALPEKLPGSDLAIEVCRVAAAEGAGIFLLGGGPGVAEAAGTRLRELLPGLVISGSHAGRADGSDDAAQRASIAATGARVVLVAFSAQDQLAWMERNLPQLPDVRAAMGVGGTLDFLAGARDPRHRFGLAARQPPGWMRRIGMDWLWRLITQPYRWRRVWTAVVTFSLHVLREGVRRARV